MRDRSTNSSKAVCDLGAIARWAVTGTPLQNRLGDLCTTFQFLKVYPYDNPKTFDAHITRLWRSGAHDVAIDRLKRLLKYILLRRPKGTVSLPKRTDKLVHLKFNSEELAHYRVSETKTVRAIEAAFVEHDLDSSGTFMNVLQQINELRLICNLGIHKTASSKIRSPGLLENFWNPLLAQKAFEALVTTGSVACFECLVDLNTAESEISSDVETSGRNYGPLLYRCLRLLCASCTTKETCSPCGHDPTCPSASVSLTSSRGDTTLSPFLSDAEKMSFPTKIKALTTDLLELPPGVKR